MAKRKNSKTAASAGTPEKLINRLVKDPHEKQWALDQVIAQGPPHKQAQHTLVLKRLEKLLDLYKKNGAAGITHLPGKTIALEQYGPGEILPLHIPEQSLAGIDQPGKVMEMLSKGPEHEMLYTALLLQGIESMIMAEQQRTSAAHSS